MSIYSQGTNTKIFDNIYFNADTWSTLFNKGAIPYNSVIPSPGMLSIAKSMWHVKTVSRKSAGAFNTENLVFGEYVNSKNDFGYIYTTSNPALKYSGTSLVPYSKGSTSATNSGYYSNSKNLVVANIPTTTTRVVTGLKTKNILMNVYVKYSTTAQTVDDLVRTGSNTSTTTTLDNYLTTYKTSNPVVMCIFAEFRILNDAGTQNKNAALTAFSEFYAPQTRYTGIDNINFIPDTNPYNSYAPLIGIMNEANYFTNYTTTTRANMYSQPPIGYMSGFPTPRILPEKNWVDNPSAGNVKVITYVCTSEQLEAFKDSFVSQLATIFKCIVNTNGSLNPLDSKSFVKDSQGNLTNGTENVNNDNYNKDLESDKNNYIDNTDLESPGVTAVGHFNRCFALSQNQVNLLADWLYNADESVFDEIIAGLALQGANPIDGIIDLRLYPFNVLDYLQTTPEIIKIGRTLTNISGQKIGANSFITIDMGRCIYPELHGGNFLDSEPYTQASLYIPFCGVVPIPSATFRGKTITVKIIVDITTGVCTAVIFCDGVIYNYVNGQMGVNIALTATNSARYAAGMVSQLINAAGSVGTIATSAASGNAGGIVSGLSGITNSVVGIGESVGNVFYQTSGSSTPTTSFSEPGYCYFVIQTVEPEEPSNYGHTVGYACSKSGVLSGFTGFTVAVNPDIDTIACTETEKEEITNLLAGGIYL